MTPKTITGSWTVTGHVNPLTGGVGYVSIADHARRLPALALSVDDALQLAVHIVLVADGNVIIDGPPQATINMNSKFIRKYIELVKGKL